MATVTILCFLLATLAFTLKLAFRRSILTDRPDLDEYSGSRKLRIVFLHPDLGIGGAENLVVNAACGLLRKGHDVLMFTSHHDVNHCMEETRGDGALASKVFVYDKLLVQNRHGILKGLYRFPLDWLEETTTGAADLILVNSRFTENVVRSSFQRLRHIHLGVLYPPVKVDDFSDSSRSSTRESSPQFSFVSPEGKKEIVFLSINRFERKKNIGLAAEALKRLQSMTSASDFAKVRLVLAGGYDPNNQENIDHLAELKVKVTEMGLQEKITFVTSFSDHEKSRLISRARCVVYTPDKEHFGIVPVEAMYAQRPVIAVNSGGPTESLVHEETGFLCAPTANAFAVAMAKFVGEDGERLSRSMGQLGRERVERLFTLERFADNLNRYLSTLYAAATIPKPEHFDRKNN